MRVLIASLLSPAVVVAFTATADAGRSSKQYRGSQCDAYCQRYPTATPRQLKNARAFDRGGEYWEQDPNTHPVGSRSWWYLKERPTGRGL
jgi:hypothetical protein